MNDLLTPSLAQEQQLVPLYSPKAGFFLAFFAGPIAITLFSALNSLRLQRLRQDLVYFVLGIVLYLVVKYLMLTAAPEGANVFTWIVEQRREEPLFRFGVKALALILWGGYYFLHRSYHRSMLLFGMDSPSPWKAAFACIGLSLLIDVPFVAGVLYLKGGVVF